MEPAAEASLPRDLAPKVLLGAVVGAVCFGLSCVKVYDPDFFWHLATGEWILREGRVPTADPFGFVTTGAPWVAHSWLAEVVMAVVHGAAGAAGVTVLKAALVSLAFVLAFRGLVRAGAHPWLSAVSLILAAAVARFQFRERPLVVMFAFSALFFFELNQARPGRTHRLFYFLPPAMLLWVNLHGSFFLGIIFVGALLLERLALLARRDLTGKGSRWSLVALLGVLGLSSFASPFGPELPRQILSDFTAFAVSHSVTIEEHQPLAFGQYPIFWGLLFATAASFAVAGRKARLFHLAVFLAGSALALSSVRFVALGAFVDAWLLALNLTPLLERLRSKPRLQLGIFAPVLVGAVALAVLANFGKGKEARLGFGINETRFPVAAVAFLARAGFSGNLFNTWELGGYALQTLPRAKTLIDGRCLPAQLELIDKLWGMEPRRLEAFLAEQSVTGALLARTDQRFGSHFAASPGFRRVFFDDQAVVYLSHQAVAALPAGLAPSPPRLIRTEGFDFSYLAPLATGPDANAAEAELREAVASAPKSFSPRFMLAFFLDAQGREEALTHYLAASELNAAFGFTHYSLGARAGRLAVRLGRGADAEAVLERAASFGEKSPGLKLLLGTAQLQQKKLPQAEATFREVLEQRPDEVDALVNLGFIYLDTARAEKAVGLFQRATAAAPAEANALYGLALSLQTSGLPDEARGQWNAFLIRFPTSPWAAKAREFVSALR